MVMTREITIRIQGSDVHVAGMNQKSTLIPETEWNLENEPTNLKRLHEIENCHVSRSYNFGHAIFRHVRRSRRDATRHAPLAPPCQILILGKNLS